MQSHLVLLALFAFFVSLVFAVIARDDAREQIKLEEQHIAEVEKMIRKPGELRPAG